MTHSREYIIMHTNECKRGDLNMKINSQKIELMAAKQGMTVTDLARAMKMTYQNFNTVRRRGSCKAVTVVRIARALNCEPEEIINPES